MIFSIFLLNFYSIQPSQFTLNTSQIYQIPQDMKFQRHEILAFCKNQKFYRKNFSDPLKFSERFSDLYQYFEDFSEKILASQPFFSQLAKISFRQNFRLRYNCGNNRGEPEKN
eukprot:TRINITY_DN1410_c0_g1_i9.p4 TRINITY_DN1410_c0_g1~~TRINITY_DN1410_c0_g1_i9.p4  ORF type:complete len:113 (-),score=1.80 TRINITY_DN1410_c0_g1_i9:1216-1554(-)